MKAMKILVGVALVASVGMNVVLWRQAQQRRAEAETLRAAATEADARRAEDEALKKPAAPSPNTERDALELARLRNEVGQLRKQSADVDVQRGQTAREVAQLRSQLASARSLAEAGKDPAAALNLTQEQMESAKQRGEAIRCVSNLKQIGLACRLWANDHKDVFPPDLASMRNELVTPKILFCPSAPGGVQATTWEQLNPATISYQFLNPNGNEGDPQKPLTFCTLHNNMGLSDGSVQMNKKP